MAECPLPIRSMRRFRGRLYGRSHHQPLGLPLDYHFCADSYERHHFHFLLCECPCLGSCRTYLTSQFRPTPLPSWWLDKLWKACHGDSSLQTRQPMLVRLSPCPSVVPAQLLCK